LAIRRAASRESGAMRHRISSRPVVPASASWRCLLAWSADGSTGKLLWIA
jgi:hypothetical protein